MKYDDAYFAAEAERAKAEYDRLKAAADAGVHEAEGEIDRALDGPSALEMLADEVVPNRNVEAIERLRAEGKRFRVLVADPAWPFGNDLPGSGRGAAKHYNLQTLPAIKAQPLPPLHDDAVVFLWRVGVFAREAYDVIDAWGFAYHSEIAWFKRGACSRCKGEGLVRSRRYVEQKTIALSGAPERVYDGLMEKRCPACDGDGEKDAFGMGRIVRGSHEICLVGVRGKGRDYLLSKSVRSAFETIADSEIVAPTGAHSEKPEAFYRLVETLFPGPYFELHARKPRPGWTTLGHQLELAEEKAEDATNQG